MPKSGKFGEAERSYLADITRSVNAGRVSFNEAVRQAAEQLGRSEKGISLYLGRMRHRTSGGAGRRRVRKLPGVNARPGDLVRAIQSLAQEQKALRTQRDALTRRLDDVDDKLQTLKDRLLTDLGIAE